MGKAIVEIENEEIKKVSAFKYIGSVLGIDIVGIVFCCIGVHR